MLRILFQLIHNLAYLYDSLLIICCLNCDDGQLGNPLIDDFLDNIGTFQFWWNHGLIGDSTYSALNKSCPYDSFLFPTNDCYEALSAAYSEFGDINPYAIYQTPCTDVGTFKTNLKIPLVSFIYILKLIFHL